MIVQVPQTSQSEIEAAQRAKQTTVLGSAGVSPAAPSVVKQPSFGKQAQVCLYNKSSPIFSYRILYMPIHSLHMISGACTCIGRGSDYILLGSLYIYGPAGIYPLAILYLLPYMMYCYTKQLVWLMPYAHTPRVLTCTEMISQ